MTTRIAVILSSSEPGVARAGAMYAANALKHGWMEDVKLFLFGPVQALALEDTELKRLLSEFAELDEQPATACRFLAEQDGTDAATRELGLGVEYVGPLISELVRDGYLPIVW